MASVAADTAQKTVALFGTCINDMMFPRTLEATATVLERLGCKVVYPKEQTCCGQLFTNTGYFDRAMPTVRSFLKAFEDYDYIVGPSGSCVGAVRHQHEMLAKDAGDFPLAERVAQVVPRVYDVSEFIVDVLGTTDVGAYFPHKVTYHPTCHSMRVAHVGDKPLQLLKAVRGIEFVELVDAKQCCGFGGTFALKNPDVSIAMAKDKAQHIADTGAEYVVAGDNMCLLNFGGVLRRQKQKTQAIHLVEVLATQDDEARRTA